LRARRDCRFPLVTGVSAAGSTALARDDDATLTVAVKTDRFDNAADWLAGGEERRIAYVA
jgi:hypothetical protein